MASPSGIRYNPSSGKLTFPGLSDSTSLSPLSGSRPMNRGPRTGSLDKGAGVETWSVVGYQPYSRQVTPPVALASTTTWHQTYAIEKKARKFRIKLYNNSTEMTVLGVSIAVSDKLGTGAQRYTPTGAWKPVTFSDSVGTTVPAGQQNIPATKWSDWIDLDTVARADGGTLPVVMIRVTIAAGAYSEGMYSTAAVWQQPSGLNNGRFVYTFKDAGDFTTGSQSSFPGTASNNGFVIGLEYEAQGKALNYIFHGDSITEGAVGTAGTGNHNNGWAWQSISALRAANPDIIIGYVNCGISSTNTNTFISRLQNYIADNSVRGVFIHAAGSPNTGWANQTAVDNQMLWLSQAKSAVDAISKPFVTWTPAPGNSQTTTTDGFRLQQRSSVLSLYGSAAMDFEGALADGATPNKYKTVPVALTTDGTHPNDAGGAAIVPVAQPKLQEFIPLAA